MNPLINSIQILNQIRQNPSAFLKQAGLDIPNGMNDPQQILQHLINSNQVSQQRYQQVLNMLGRR